MSRTPEQNKVYMREYYRKNKDKWKGSTLVWRIAHPEEAKAMSARWRNKNADYAHNYYVTHKAEISSRVREWDRLHPEKVALSKRKWAKSHSAFTNAQTAKRRAALLQATPIWSTDSDWKKIEACYREAKRLEQRDGIKRHVDHIYPLLGKTCRGLHVPWNLQILTDKDNWKKGNRL